MALLLIHPHFKGGIKMEEIIKIIDEKSIIEFEKIKDKDVYLWRE